MQVYLVVASCPEIITKCCTVLCSGYYISYYITYVISFILYHLVFGSHWWW